MIQADFFYYPKIPDAIKGKMIAPRNRHNAIMTIITLMTMLFLGGSPYEPGFEFFLSIKIPLICYYFLFLLNPFEPPRFFLLECSLLLPPPEL